MFYVYYLESEKFDEYYVGSTNDLKRRFKEHNQGLNFSTKKYKPWKLVYYEAGLNNDDARRREKYLKTGQGRRMLKARIKEYLYGKRKI
jgi:putative endonuclease